LEKGEALGSDSAWVRSRHLEREIVGCHVPGRRLATDAVDQARNGGHSVHYDNPSRLAEDFATVDLLSKGR
jgi:hypothetical protein